MRDGEDSVEVLAGQQAQHLRVDPARAGGLYTSRAGAVTASVRLQPLKVPFRAPQHMRAKRRRVALADGPGRALLTAMQRARRCIRRVVLDEDVLKRAAHGVKREGLFGALRVLCHVVAMSNVRAKRGTTA
jgi:hypothetical protein